MKRSNKRQPGIRTASALNTVESTAFELPFLGVASRQPELLCLFQEPDRRPLSDGHLMISKQLNLVDGLRFLGKVLRGREGGGDCDDSDEYDGDAHDSLVNAQDIPDDGEPRTLR